MERDEINVDRQGLHHWECCKLGWVGVVNGTGSHCSILSPVVVMCQLAFLNNHWLVCGEWEPQNDGNRGGTLCGRLTTDDADFCWDGMVYQHREKRKRLCFYFLQCFSLIQVRYWKCSNFLLKENTNVSVGMPWIPFLCTDLWEVQRGIRNSSSF